MPTERTRSQIQEAEIRFLLQVAGFCLRDEVRSQLRWFRPSDKDASGTTLLGVVPGTCICVHAPGRARTRCRDYMSNLAWGSVRVHQEELESVAGENEA